jgi:IS5 family transposase
MEHYRDLMQQVIDKTKCRVIDKESIHSSEKLVGLFEPHTNIIVKGFRDV